MTSLFFSRIIVMNTGYGDRYVPVDPTPRKRREETNKGMEYILETNQLTKIYGQKEAAKDINLHIKEGQIYGLIGRNGAGKTTLMYSLGMRQRLGIALALVGDPKMIILDEPINGLDPQGIAEVREMLSKLRDERGITIMISSHILDELSKIADAYGIIHEGTLLDEFSAQELHKRCGRSLILRTDDTAKTLQILENMDIRGAVREPDGSLKIGQGMEQAKEISRAIVGAGIGLEEIYTRTMTLEDYYLGMTGGAHNG